MNSLEGKSVFVTGSSRGIGFAIALECALRGANVTVAAKTTEENPKLPGTIYSAANEITRLTGRKALAVVCDIRFEEQIQAAINQSVAAFGGLDILVNNASAISLTTTPETSVKKYDLMASINGRGTWLCSKIALPHLKRSAHLGRQPHILIISPPLDLRPQWFANHTAYSMQKYAMSLCTLGLAAELENDGIAVNSLWPMTAIDTSAMHNVIDTDKSSKNRNVKIMSDAAGVILSQPSRQFTGKFCIDELVLRMQGVTDFSKYRDKAVKSDSELSLDFFLPADPYSATVAVPVQALAVPKL